MWLWRMLLSSGEGVYRDGRCWISTILSTFSSRREGSRLTVGRLRHAAATLLLALLSMASTLPTCSCFSRSCLVSSRHVSCRRWREGGADRGVTSKPRPPITDARPWPEMALPEHTQQLFHSRQLFLGNQLASMIKRDPLDL